MYFQVAAKYNGVGAGFRYDRPHTPVESFERVRGQYNEVQDRYPRPLEVVVLMAEDIPGLQEAYDDYMAGKYDHLLSADDDTAREVIEMAPLRDNYDYPEPRFSFNDYSWSPATYGAIIRLMAQVHADKLGGERDGE